MREDRGWPSRRSCRRHALAEHQLLWQKRSCRLSYPPEIDKREYECELVPELRIAVAYDDDGDAAAHITNYVHGQFLFRKETDGHGQVGQLEN